MTKKADLFRTLADVRQALMFLAAKKGPAVAGPMVAKPGQKFKAVGRA